MGVGLTAIIVLALSACGATAQEQDRIPGAQLAPVTTVTGLIAAEADQYGVLAAGWSVSDTPDGPVTTFSEPHYPVVFDAAGAFTVTLPETTEKQAVPGLACPYDGAYAAVGALHALTEPAADGTTRAGTTRSAYRLESGDALAFYWYSPNNQRVTCTNTDRGNMSGGLTEDWDLRLAAGWNMVLAYLSDDRNVMRTGTLPGLEWAPIAP